MTDLDLLLLGCVVSFIAFAGAYVAIRERFTEPGPQPEERRRERLRAARARVREIREALALPRR